MNKNFEPLSEKEEEIGKQIVNLAYKVHCTLIILIKKDIFMFSWLRAFVA
jgi:hypothetical protein